MQDLAIEPTPLVRIRLYMEDVLYGEGDTISRLSTPVKMRLMLQALGPTFVKFGKIISSRPELVSPEWRVELDKLQSDVPSFSSETAQRIIKDQLHEPVEELYASFDKEPLRRGVYRPGAQGQPHGRYRRGGQDPAPRY